MFQGATQILQKTSDYFSAPRSKFVYFYKKILLNELKFSGDKKVSYAALNLSEALNSEWLFSSRLRYAKFKFHSMTLCKENRGLHCKYVQWNYSGSALKQM